METFFQVSYKQTSVYVNSTLTCTDANFLQSGVTLACLVS